MMVRRYVVKDMPEAVVLIRKDLGKGAVILSTKRITLKKWLGIWRYKRIEVLAAVGDDIPVRASTPQFQNQGRPRAAGNVLASLNDASPSAPPDPVASVEHKDAFASPSDDVGDHEGMTARLNVRQVPLAAGYAKIGESGSVNGDAEVRVLRQDISDIKNLLQVTLANQNGQSPTIVQHLLSQGVDEARAWSLLREELNSASDVSNGSKPAGQQSDGSHLERVRHDLNSRILNRLHPFCDPKPIAPSSRLVAFVGPTGVGKTTTIAKLAALHVLTGKRKVGLVTMDTFRIAAVEQLRTYANILNVPLQVAYGKDDLPSAMHELADRDLILMDTAGRNFRSEDDVQRIGALLSSMPVDETFLVLSMTSKPKDLDDLASTFCKLPVDKFLFTKLDETSTYGAILNLLLTYRKPVSYVTTGQNVPDDIEVASLEKLLRLILGGAA